MIPIEPGFYYHIYNHANGDEDIFKEERNYVYFLDKYKKYIHPIANTFAYCLMKNHFHLLVKIKEEKEIGYYKPLNSDRSDDSVRFKTTQNLSEFEEPDRVGQKKQPSPSKHFSHLFNSYTNYYNKSYSRKGSLFNRPFKRKQITSDRQLQNCLIYIHLNPVLHGFTRLPENWKYSSYSAYLKRESKSLINKEEAIEWFEDRDNLLACHTIRRAQMFEEEE